MTMIESPHRFKDTEAQAISNKWYSLEETATVEQKNQIGFLYISKFLGLGDETAQKFAQGEFNADHAVGTKQSGIPMEIDVAPFWEEVRKVFPNLHTDEEIKFLVKKGGVTGVLELTYHLIFTENSPMLHRIFLNASRYK
jgi:hypothetical protein